MRIFSPALHDSERICHIGQFICLLMLVLSLSSLMSLAYGSESESQALGLPELHSRQYKMLDQVLNARQADYERGRITDVDLLNYLRPLYSGSADDEVYFLEWVKQYPESYAAHVAAAAYYRHVAADVRGTGYVSQTPPAQLQAMETYLEKAEKQARISLTLARKPTLSYVQLIGIDQYVGDSQDARAMLDRAIAAAPDNFIVRRKYMYVIQSRWLGDLPTERAFYEECSRAHLSQQETQVLRGMIELDEGSILNDQKKYVEAWKAYRNGVMLLDQNSALTEANCMPCTYGMAAAVANNAHDFAAGLLYANKVLQGDPNSYYGHLYRAQALYGLSRLAEAVPDLQVAAAGGDEWSRNMLMYCYRNHIGVTPGQGVVPAQQPSPLLRAPDRGSSHWN